MFGISRERAKSSVGILLEMGVCRIDGPHLTMTSLNRHEYGNKNLPIQSYNNTNITNLKEVEKFLRLQAVYFKQSQIDYAVNTLRGIRNPRTQREYRRAKSNKGKLNPSWNGQLDQGMSLKTVCKAAVVGKNSAVELLKWGISKNLLQKRQRITLVGASFCDTNLINETLNNTHARFFSHRGKLFQSLPSILIFEQPYTAS